MNHGGASFNSQAPQARQCRVRTSRASANTTLVGELPHKSTVTGGVRAMPLIGPIMRSLQKSAPFLSLLVHAHIRNIAIPQSSFGSGIIPPQKRVLDNSRLFRAGSKSLTRILVNGHLALRRGFAGPIPTDCIRHDDYRSADFAGPRVSA